MTALRLNPTSGTPLYVQLVERLKHSIATGAIKAGEQLPSVRKMAEDLVINPNTVVRAYRDLESEGIVELRHGSGVFVRESVAARADVMKKGATDHALGGGPSRVAGPDRRRDTPAHGERARPPAATEARKRRA